MSVRIIARLWILIGLSIVHILVTIHDALSASRRRWVALAVVCLGQLMMVVDATIVNVALPSIQRDLAFSQADLTWVVNAYMIAFASFLLMAGRLGDLAGRKKIFLIGLALFTAASALCGFAGSQVMLIAARFVQGLGGAVASSAVLALIAFTRSTGLGNSVTMRARTAEDATAPPRPCTKRAAISMT